MIRRAAVAVFMVMLGCGSTEGPTADVTTVSDSTPDDASDDALLDLLVVDARDDGPGLDAPDVHPPTDRGLDAREVAGDDGPEVAPCDNLALTRCGDRCRDLRSDDLHCGACDRACGRGERCVSGRCATACLVGEEICGRCVPDGADFVNCGA